MHRGLPEGNTKLVLKLSRPWALPTLGRVFGCFLGPFLLLEISAKHRLVVQLHTAGFTSTRRTSSVLSEVQRCICMNAWIMQ